MNIVPDYNINKEGKRISRYWGFNIDEVEKQKNARFVCEVCCRTKSGEWAEEPIAVFYQEVPPNPEYSHYFGLFIRGDSLYITGGQSAVNDPLIGIVADNGDVIYSAYRHDFRTSPDKSVWIDGGRDYVRTGGEKTVQIKIIEDKLVIIEDKTAV